VLYDDMLTLRPEITSNDGNPNLSRLRAFLVEQGWSGNLEWQFSTAEGAIINLTGSLPTPYPNADPLLNPVVSVRFNELTMQCVPKVPIGVTGTLVTAASGLATIEIPQYVADTAGIYNVDVAYVVGGKNRIINKYLLSVNGSLFGNENFGPPSIQEIRLAARDSSATDNNLLLNVEYDNAEIVYAILQPLRDWNELPPHIGEYSSHSFPYRGQWVKAILGYLHKIAANHYRRNQLAVQAGGITQDEKNKNQPYEQAAQLYLQEWRDFMINEKRQLSYSQCYGFFH
jgi:hypothetical protein